MQSWLGTITAEPTADADADAEVVRSALAARDLIAEAKTVLMEQHDLSAFEAFELLRHLSRTADRPLRDVALKVVHGTWVADA